MHGLHGPWRPCKTYLLLRLGPNWCTHQNWLPKLVVFNLRRLSSLPSFGQLACTHAAELTCSAIVHHAICMYYPSLLALQLSCLPSPSLQHHHTAIRLLPSMSCLTCPPGTGLHQIIYTRHMHALRKNQCAPGLSPSPRRCDHMHASSMHGVQGSTSILTKPSMLASPCHLIGATAVGSC